MRKEKKNNILLIPIDNRPVCYQLPLQLAEINNTVNLIIPPREYLGDLTKRSDFDNILNRLEKNIKENPLHACIISLDTIIYGGLIQSRREKFTIEEINSRLDRLKQIFKSIKNDTKIYCLSSIMRISNNNINEEEKEYWNRFGELIYQYSYLLHKGDTDKVSELKTIIPKEILNDYLETRKRNFEINKSYIGWLKEGIIDFIVFCQDDTGEFGINIQEADELENLVTNLNGQVKTGMDEIPLSLMSKAITEIKNKKIKIYPIYTTENGKNIISRYEDKSIENSVKNQIELNGGILAKNQDDADMCIIVHTPNFEQNDHAMNIHSEKTTEKTLQNTEKLLQQLNKPFIFADIANANGGDDVFVENIILENIKLKHFYGYAGWNTTSNTLGSVICMGMIKYIAQKNNTFNQKAFQKVVFIRLADDWAYQTIVRQKIRALSSDLIDENNLTLSIMPYLSKISKNLDINLNKIKLSFPWNRTFEIEINIK
ncbi:MAG: DUF4127 family protein [Candidatus Gastranaerophilales bacterium]|nr:DUF4127 family protein [Candidatus Gastranaerophilales bacterium]